MRKLRLSAGKFEEKKKKNRVIGMMPDKLGAIMP